MYSICPNHLFCILFDMSVSVPDQHQTFLSSLWEAYSALSKIEGYRSFRLNRGIVCCCLHGSSRFDPMLFIECVFCLLTSAARRGMGPDSHGRAPPLGHASQPIAVITFVPYAHAVCVHFAADAAVWEGTRPRARHGCAGSQVNEHTHIPVWSAAKYPSPENWTPPATQQIQLGNPLCFVRLRASQCTILEVHQVHSTSAQYM